MCSVETDLVQGPGLEVLHPKLIDSRSVGIEEQTAPVRGHSRGLFHRSLGGHSSSRPRLRIEKPHIGSRVHTGVRHGPTIRCDDRTYILSHAGRKALRRPRAAHAFSLVEGHTPEVERTSTR